MAEEAPQTRLDRGARRTLWFTGTVAVSTVVYTVLTLLMFYQVKTSNDLVRQEQRLSLRPYVMIENVMVAYQQPGTPNESWMINSVVVNKGVLPAIDVQAYSWVDGSRELLVKDKPGELTTYRLSQGGGTAAIAFVIPRQQATSLQATGGCFLHTLVWYKSPSGTSYSLRGTYGLAYEEGKLLNWNVTEISGD